MIKVHELYVLEIFCHIQKIIFLFHYFSSLPCKFFPSARFLQAKVKKYLQKKKIARIIMVLIVQQKKNNLKKYIFLFVLFFPPLCTDYNVVCNICTEKVF